MRDYFRATAEEYAHPLEEFLGERTLRVIRAAPRAKAAILKKPEASAPRRPEDYARLTPRRKLSEAQVAELRSVLNDPASYWHGMPKYRRFPPRPGFSIVLEWAGDEVQLLVDLQNPG